MGKISRQAKSAPGRKIPPPEKNPPPRQQKAPVEDRKYVVELRLFTSDATPPLFRTIRRECTDHKDYPMVAQWNYIVSKRLRLTTAPVGAGLNELERLVAKYLRGDSEESDEAFIRELARAEVIEVSMPYDSEAVGWAARLFPWENALSIITRRYRQRSLVVVRHLDRAAAWKALDEPREPRNVLVVRSTPGDFAGTYDFRSQSALVKYKLGCAEPVFRDLDTPTPEIIAEALRETRPDVIHLAVLSAHRIAVSRPELVRRAWSEKTTESEKHDGILLRGAESPYLALGATEAGELVTGGGTQGPLLVSYATGNSAARFAPMAVANGARAAIGFHEDLTDTVAEAFFGAFYEAWRETGWDLLKAFQTALGVMWGQPESGRSGVALWSAVSLVTGRTQSTTPIQRYRQPAPGPRAAAVPKNADLRAMFSVACAPLRKVNYCSLHNGRDLFSAFTIKKNAPGMVGPVEVRVELTAESETAVWRQSLAFGDAPGTESLASRVRVPLGARALRRVQESTRSSLFVEVRCQSQVLWQESREVTLLPVDEWRDTDEDRRWLPSFVLPRDPAVRRIVSAADRYLRALRDDAGAGFDGYQQAEEWPEVVDMQVRAIWSALLYDLRLGYINPPPTYTKTDNGIAQRLRTPSQIMEEGRGTCIDLALLLASCLEYVGIYPVIFLISGHAFPGWWRSEQAYQAFAGFTYLPMPTGKAEAMAKRGPAPTDEYAQWMVTGITGFGELVTPLREGGLAALESTMMCASGAFEAALQQGNENLLDPAIFDALINVQRAREGDNPVTPLPIVGVQAALPDPLDPGLFPLSR